MKLHHIGIAVKSIDRQQAALTEQFGAAPVGEPVYDPIQDATLRMYALPDGTQIELVEGDSVKNCVRGGAEKLYLPPVLRDRRPRRADRFDGHAWRSPLQRACARCSVCRPQGRFLAYEGHDGRAAGEVGGLHHRSEYSRDRRKLKKWRI